MDAALAYPQASFESLLAGLRRDAGHWAIDTGGLVMRSSFQPVYSLALGRAVGHEALLRAEDASGRALSPPQALRGDGSFADLLRGDRAARLIHSLNFAEMAGPAHWLFVNMPPQVFVALPLLMRDGFQQALQQRSGLQGSQGVIEVLEESVPEDTDFDGAIAAVRESGCLIALDDFGAGHSNFDRVWRLEPEIVKLDRSLVRRAALAPQARRVLAQLVSLLHQCGALVLMEGVETQEEAFVTLEVNADLVQGDLFGRPAPELVAPGDVPQALLRLWGDYEQRRAQDQRAYHERLRPYINAIGYASALLADGRTLAEASTAFLQLPSAEVSFLLDYDGRQIGDNVWAAPLDEGGPPAFAPLRASAGAQWARRPYHRRALETVGKLQVTRPYRTLHGGHLCVTVSVAFRCAGGLCVVCGDLRWEGG